MLDEWKVIDIIVKTIGHPKKIFSPIGDDVAWTKKAMTKDKFAIKCDMLVGNTDVPRGMTLRQAARKSIVACVSDFASKGVKPWGSLISLGIPRNFNEEKVHELANGFKDAQAEYGIEIVGGDTNETTDLIIDCVMFGWGKHISSRDGADVDEVVCVTGDFGLQPLGLDILSSVKQIKNPRLKERAVNSVLYPRARLDFGLAINKMEMMTSSLDSSDGLAISLHGIAQHSHVDILLNEIPIDDALRANGELGEKEKADYTLFGGEEYEIVFTCKLRDYSKVQKIAEDTGVHVRKIGTTLEGAGRVYLNGEVLPKKGWVHFT